MKKALKDILPFAEGISRLLHPFAEVVIHDLKKDQIEAIYNPFSKRKVGESSYLDRMNLDHSETIIGPYDKTNWDGRALKSISIVLRDQKKKAEGFLCINIDVSAFQNVNSMLQSFLNNNAKLTQQTQKLFKDDLYEKINLYIQKYVQKHQVSLESLNRHHKKKLIQQLLKDGAFKGKNAANYIGRILKISRATVYNYLK